MIEDQINELPTKWWITLITKSLWIWKFEFWVDKLYILWDFIFVYGMQRKIIAFLD